jgi:hypothetical protein
MSRAVIGTYLRANQVRALESAADDVVELHHYDTVRDLVQFSAHGFLSAVLVSAERMEAPDIRAIAALAAQFPVNEIVGVTTDGAMQGVLRLGRAGVSRLVDMRLNSGPGLLRSIFDGIGAPDGFGRQAVRTLLDGVQCTPAFAREIGLCFDPTIRNARALSGMLGMNNMTLLTRHHRAGLPSAKEYIAHARLAWGAHYGESKGITSGQVAYRLGVSTGGAWSRMVKLWAGLTADEFYDRWTGVSYVAHMRETMIEPYLAQLRNFDPGASALYRGGRHSRRRLMLVPDAVAA